VQTRGGGTGRAGDLVAIAITPVQNLLVQTHRGAIGIWTTYVDWRSVRRIARQAPVIVPEGLVGRVVRVRSGASVIQLLNDPASTVGAMVQRTRTPGLVEGDAGMALAIGNCGIYPGFPWVCGQRIRYW
jgi:hypothetical protein